MLQTFRPKDKERIIKILDEAEINMNHLFEKLFKAKDLFHRELSKISFDKKIKILIQLQKIANGVRPSLKRNQRVWKF